jgi:hypothetical protein
MRDMQRSQCLQIGGGYAPKADAIEVVLEVQGRGVRRPCQRGRIEVAREWRDLLQKIKTYGGPALAAVSRLSRQSTINTMSGILSPRHAGQASTVLRKA